MSEMFVPMDLAVIAKELLDDVDTHANIERAQVEALMGIGYALTGIAAALSQISEQLADPRRQSR